MSTPEPQEINQYFLNYDQQDLERRISGSRTHLQDLNLMHMGRDGRSNLRIQIDPKPTILAPEDFSFLQDAGSQWCRLLGMIHNDLWSKQDLLTQGLIDASLLWDELGFDPGQGAPSPRQSESLSLVRLDLTKSLSGNWSVKSLGTQIPRGLGYMIGNRIVHSRYFASEAPQGSLIRLAPFLKSLKDHWFHSSLTHKEEPSIAIWTEGPVDEHYFESVYLSRYFGYPLVESRDLTVRSGKVFLKTLGDLQPVDVLVRMVPDSRVDPLMGNPGTGMGVAGLIQAYRDGSVLITNAPGSGILENPGLWKSFPSMSKELLGESLKIPPSGPLNEMGEDEFFENGSWSAHPVMFRVFFARTSEGWQMIPGGIVQKLQKEITEEPIFGTHKDLWFLSKSFVPRQSLLPRKEKPTPINRIADLPSRVADDLYWLGRYTERAWIDLRFLEKSLQNPFEGRMEEESIAQRVLDELLLSLGVVKRNSEAQIPEQTSTRLSFLLSEVSRISSQVMDRLSIENHHILRQLGAFGQITQNLRSWENLRRIKLLLSAFNGLAMESMTRTPGWLFLDIGRRLERALTVCESLGAFFALESGEGPLSLLLDVFDGVLTYSSRYRLSPQSAPVVDLLLLDPTNPRSLVYQVERLEEHVELLPKESVRPYKSPLERVVLELLTKIRLVDATSLVSGPLADFLEDVENKLDDISDSLYHTYLAKIDTMASLKSRGALSSP